MRGFWTDVRYALRLLRRTPGWTAVAAFSLAAGIAANGTVFSLVNAVLLDPFPYQDSERLVFLWGSRSRETTRGISGADLADWRTEGRTFAEIDAFLGNLEYSLDANASGRIQAACIGHRVLPLLGVQPALGRNFTAEEARYGADPVILISDGLWRDRFGADPAVVGRSIALGERSSAVVIGVTPPGFFFPDTDARLWIPAPCGFPNFDQRGSMLLHAVGRLQPGVTAAEAQADVDRINAANADEAGGTPVTTGVFPIRTILVGDYDRALWTLLAAVALVLLIVCVNVVHLQLARGIDREGELAIRTAAGASPGRRVRQLLTESLTLSGLACAAGVALCWMGVRAIEAFGLTDIPRMEQARIDGPLVAFMVGLSLLAGLLSGLWPAWNASRVRPSDTLNAGAAATIGARQSQARDLLAITEVAIAVTLIVVSGLVVRSFVLISRADWGFNPDNLLLMTVQPATSIARDRVQRMEFVDVVSDRLRRLSDVERVSVTDNAPIRWQVWWPRPLLVDGELSTVTAGVWAVGPSYFVTAGVPILDGRAFDDREAADHPRTVVLSQSLARRLWPGEQAVGRTLEIPDLRAGITQADLAARLRQAILPTASDYEAIDGAIWEVVGVAGDVRMHSLEAPGNPVLYLDARQYPRAWIGTEPLRLHVLLRTTGRPVDVVEPARAAMLDLYPDLTFTEIVPMAEVVAQSIGGRGSTKLLAVVAGTFGTMALGFAALGIYGLVAHGVSRRLREIGVRVALGATRRDVVRLVVGHTLRLVAFGLALGLTMAWAITRHLDALLFQVTPHDALTYSASAGLLVLAALLACAAPLRRALGLDVARLFR